MPLNRRGEWGHATSFLRRGCGRGDAWRKKMWNVECNNKTLNEDMNNLKNLRVLVKDMYMWELIRSWLKGGRQWIFRGQGNSAWELSNGTERDIMPPPFFTDDSMVRFERRWFERERENIKIFQERFDSFFRGRARPISMVGWIALMQHYGVPTRFLDFSYSLDVALYMATQGGICVNGTFSVWAVDVNWMSECRVLGSVCDNDNDFIERQLIEDLDVVAKESLRYHESLAYVDNLHQEDRNANWRIGSQKGLFLAPCSFPCDCRGIVSQLFIGGNYLTTLYRCPYFGYSGLPPDRGWKETEVLMNSYRVLEFVFPEGLKLLVRNMAESHGCFDETMYPDYKLVDMNRLKDGIDYDDMCKAWPFA